MCGIAGILSLPAGPAQQDEALAKRLDRMSKALAHRGPDGAGVWIADDQSIGFAHRRLAVIDLSPAAAQPMRHAEAEITVVFNGEIYNHLALRRELEAHGARFVTDHADTEVLLHGFVTWGLPGLLERLDGMFAFALWDGRHRRLHLVRDRFGVKPLYYSVRDGVLRFASEAKAILADAAGAPAFDPLALRLYLSFLVAPAPLTLFSGIFKLPAGHFLTVSATGGCQATRWWHPLGGTRREPGGNAAAAIREQLEAAVVKRLVGDVPVGILLSGGVDSTAIAHFASRASPNTIESFTVGFDMPTPLDETESARACAERLGLRHHEIRIGAGDVVPLLEKAVHHQDEPLADWVCLPLLAVARLAAEHGIKVVLAGEGADEMFCGYPGYFTYELFEARYGRLMRVLPRVAAELVVGAVGALGGVSSRFAALHQPLRLAAAGRPVFRGGALAFNEEEAEELTALPVGHTSPAPPGFGQLCWQSAGDVIAEFERTLHEECGELDYLTRLTYIETQLRLPELLLMRLDKMAMAHGVEVREPFLDRELTRRVLSLSAAERVPHGRPKGLLKQALRGIVPDAVLDSPKRGFGVPIADWLRGPLGEELESAVLGGALARQGMIEPAAMRRLFTEHRQGRADRSVPIWTAVNLSFWYARWAG